MSGGCPKGDPRYRNNIPYTNSIKVRDTYNYNKIGIRLGIGKKEKVIIEVIRGRIKSGITITRKSYILRECISIDSNIILLLLVLKGKIY